VDPLPTSANAGTDKTICAPSDTLYGNVAISGTGIWTVVSGSGIIANANSAKTYVSGLNVGINKFLWSISSGSCPVSRDTITITVDAYPTIANAGSDIIICALTDTLYGNAAIIGTGVWKVVSGSGTIANGTSAKTYVSNLGIGVNIFAWTISNGSCVPSRDTVTITVDALPTFANAGTDLTICAYADTLRGNVPSIGNGIWTLVSGAGTIVNTSSAKTSVYSLGTGINKFVWTISNGTCPVSRDTVTVTVDALPSIANAGNNVTICNTTDSLYGNIPLIGSGSWTLVSGSGSISNSTSAKTSVWGLGLGINKFVWTISNGSCPQSKDTVTVTVDQLPTVSNAGADQQICAGSTIITGNTPVIGSGTWSLAFGTGTVTNSTSASSAVTGLSTGKNKFVWTIINGSCPPSCDTVTIVVDALPSVSNAGINQQICNSASKFTATIPLIGTGTWSLISGTGSITSFNSPSSNVFGLSLGQNIFVWRVSNGSCPSSSDTVVIQVDENPSLAEAGPDKVVFSQITYMAANTPVIGTGHWSVVSGKATFANENDPYTKVSSLEPGSTNVLRWTISNGVCGDSFDDVIISLNELTIPNGFSPNGDGVNDMFAVEGLLEFLNVKFNVFNRWGNLVYENHNYLNDWDGKNNIGQELTEDTYYYLLQVSDETLFKGFIVLKRK